MRNFIGHDGFIWWVGIVEDIDDPLTLGRCKVRIFGYHPAKNTDLVPTEDLPWATTIHSVNTRNLYAPLEKGDWVFGFFLDALSAQEPAIMGYYPSVPETSDKNFSDELTKTRNFARVHDAKNSSNTFCWEIGNNIIEVIKESATEANGHILIQHATGAKINIDTNGNVLVYTPNSNITLQTDSGDIDLRANNITLSAQSNLTLTTQNNLNISAGGYIDVKSDLYTSITAGGLISFTAAGALLATAGAYLSATSLGNFTAKTIAGILNIESANSMLVTSNGTLTVTSTEAISVTTDSTMDVVAADNLRLKGSHLQLQQGTTLDLTLDDIMSEIDVAKTLPDDAFAKAVAAATIF
jgi:uncharacterized protein (DUF2345 family)